MHMTTIAHLEGLALTDSQCPIAALYILNICHSVHTKRENMVRRMAKLNLCTSDQLLDALWTGLIPSCAACSKPNTQDAVSDDIYKTFHALTLPTLLHMEQIPCSYTGL